MWLPLLGVGKVSPEDDGAGHDLLSRSGSCREVSQQTRRGRQAGASMGRCVELGLAGNMKVCCSYCLRLLGEAERNKSSNYYWTGAHEVKMDLPGFCRLGKWSHYVWRKEICIASNKCRLV